MQLVSPSRILAAILAIASLVCPVVAQADRWLWAWDRPEDLRWLPQGTGVAYFAVQFDASDAAFKPTWRRAVLLVAANTPLMPVLHIQSLHTSHPAVLNGDAVALWSSNLAEAIRHLNAQAVQIDFEARASQQAFYHEVLTALRRKLPTTVQLSITALASWCGNDAWLVSLPVDEVVPMYFRMGPSERTLWRRRMMAPANLPPICRRAAGISIDEWDALQKDTGAISLMLSDRRRFYLFAPHPWQAPMLEGFAPLAVTPVYTTELFAIDAAQ